MRKKYEVEVCKHILVNKCSLTNLFETKKYEVNYFDHYLP